MGHAEILEMLYPLLLKHGKPHYIRSDNGSEFIARNLQSWLKKVGIMPIQIYPGSPWENGYVEVPEPDHARVVFAEFRADPVANKLRTPSGNFYSLCGLSLIRLSPGRRTLGSP